MAAALKLLSFFASIFDSIPLFFLILLTLVIGVLFWIYYRATTGIYSLTNIKNPDEFVADQRLRDKVLKQGFATKKLPSNLDAIVIGSGVGGLTTAAFLAKHGKRVLVLEQHDQAGGCCHTFIENGYEFDVGIHYVGEMAPGTQNFEMLNQLTNGQLVWTKLSKDFDSVVLGRQRIPICSPKCEFKKQLLERFPAEKDAIERFCRYLGRIAIQGYGLALPKFLPLTAAKFLLKTGILRWLTSDSHLQLLGMSKLPVNKAILFGGFIMTNNNKTGDNLFYAYNDMNLLDTVKQLTNDPCLQAIMCYNFGDYGALPSESSFGMQCLILNHFLMFGAFYPRGGASEVAFHLIPTIEEAGGRVLVRAPVTQILVNAKGEAEGVRVRKGDSDIDIHAPIIVSTAGVTNTFNRLLPEEIAEKSGFHGMIPHSGVRPGIACIQLFVGLNGTTESLHLQAQNTWYFPDESFDLTGAMQKYYALSVHEASESPVPCTFISFPSAKDPTWQSRYPGKSAAIVITLCPYEWFEPWENERVKNRGEEYEALKAGFERQLLRRTFELYPHLEEHVEYKVLGTPVSHAYYVGWNRGEMYGLDHHLQRFGPHANTILHPQTMIPNLYISGQDIFTGGLCGALMAGALTASSILKRNQFIDVLCFQAKNFVTDCFSRNTKKALDDDGDDVKKSEAVANGRPSSDNACNSPFNGHVQSEMNGCTTVLNG